MRFEVRYPSGTTHEVVLEGTLATLGRDPTCDIVLNDAKCSRRHAVIEAGPQGMSIRDTGSANGIYVNDRKTDRSPLKDGDVVRLGDVTVTVLEEDMPGTLVMEDLDMPVHTPDFDLPPPRLTARTATIPPADGLPPDPLPPKRVPAPAPARPELTSAMPTVAPPRPAAPRPPLTPAAAPPSPMPPPRPAPSPRSVPPTPHGGMGAARHPVAAARPPLTVMVLAALWVLSIPFWAVVGIMLAPYMTGSTGLAVALVGAALAILGGIMAFGLWNAQPWARPVQIGVAGLGVLNCPFTIASIVVLAYMLRPAARRFFDGGEAPAPDEADQSEAVFAAAIVAAVVLGALITGAATFMARTAKTDLGPLTLRAPAAVAPLPSVRYKQGG